MKRLIFLLVLCSLPLSLFGQDVVEKIEIVGNERVTKETIEYYLSSRTGDFYSRDLFQRDFRVLWATGFFSDIKIEETQGEHGKIIRVIVAENPVIKDIKYKTGKKVKEDDIVEKLKENDEYLLPYSYYSEHKIRRIEKTIKDLLAEKGMAAGEVRTEVNPTGTNELEIIFDINEGHRIKVGEIVFEGNTKLPANTLMAAFKENRKHNFYSWISGKDAFKENQITEDLVNLKTKLQEMGFMEATIGEPRYEDITKRSIFFKKQTMKRLIVPVDPGYRYFVGNIDIEGNETFSKEDLLSLIKFDRNGVYNTKIREKAVEKIGELYRDWGYLYIQVRPVEKLDPVHKRVHVTFHIFEGEVAYLNRLEFKGNIFTRDKVIRREMILREGDRFSFALFKDSLLRMNQLGLVELQGDPEITPNPEDPTQIDVTVNITELQRNNVQFSAGYSGYQGTFVSLSYSTVNFLGAGEKLELALQYGKRLRNYSFGFTEPYFLDLPISLGFNVHDMYMVLPGLYNRRGRGADFSFGARLLGYWQSRMVYSYEFLDISPYEGDVDDPFINPFLDPYGMNQYYLPGYGYGKYNISALSPTIYRNTVDSPLTPSKGSLYLVSVKYAGTFLGGDIDMIKPRFELTRYLPVIKNQSLGLHVEYSFIKSIGDSEPPFWERFFLGGERSIRGYNIYTIGPRDTETGVNLGGEKSFVFNAEYIIPVGGPLYAILFYDMGNALAPGQKLDFKNMFTSTGLELRIFVPALRVPFRLIFAYNNRLIYRGDSNYNFRFAIGTTF